MSPSGHPLAPAVTDLDTSLDPRRVLATVIRRKYQVLLVALLAVVPVAIATYLTKPLYRSVLLLQINPESARILPFRDVTDLIGGTQDFELYMKTQDQILRSPSMAARVAARLKERKDAADNPDVRGFPSGLEILRIPNSQLVNVAYVASDPTLAADIVNLYGEEYIKQHFEAKQATRDKAEAFLRKELAQLKEKLEVSERESIDYGQKNRLNTENLVQQKLAFVTQQVSDVETEMITAKTRLERLADASLEKFPPSLVTPNISQLESRLLVLQQELTDLLTRFDENWPGVIRKREEIKLVTRQLREEKEQVLSQQLQSAQADYRGIERKYEMLVKKRSEQENLAEQLTNASVQANILKREAETNQQLYNGLMERLKQTSVTAGLEFGNINIVEPGKVNRVAYGPKVWWNLSLALFFGLALGVGVALVRDYWDRSIGSLQEVEQTLLLPALGVIPMVRELSRGQNGGLLKGKGDNGLPALSIRPVAGNGSVEKLSPVAREAFRTVCASILLSSSNVPRTILVTSAVPGEGKTTLVAELGKAFAESGARTVLLELDLRKPVLAARLGIAGHSGASLFLAGHTPDSELPAVQASRFENLYVIPSGPKPPNPIALLNSDRLTHLLAGLKKDFKFILIDSPPALTVADAWVIGAKVDGVVLVMRAHQTPKDLIRRAQFQMTNAGARFLGCTLNGIAPTHSYGSSYPQYYQGGSYYS